MSQEALRHFNQTVALKQMLLLVENYLDLDDEVRLGSLTSTHDM